MGQADELEQRLARQKGAAGDPPARDVPPGFDEWLAALSPSPAPDAVRPEQARLALQAERLFGQLGSADNEVVQRARRRQIRTLINALRQLERLAPPENLRLNPDAGV